MTKKYKGAVFFDADGTMVDERLGIYKATDKTREAICRLKQNGYLTGFATGRAAFYLPDIGVDFDCKVVCNGALSIADNEIIFCDRFESDKLDHAIDFMHKNGYFYCFESYDKGYYNGKAVDAMLAMLESFHISPSLFSPCVDHKSIDIIKLMTFFDTDKQFDDLKNELVGDFIVCRHHTAYSADIIKPGINKAVGIKATIKHFGIDIKDTYAFGDDTNDVEMLSEVGCGIAMTPHASVLDTVADMFTGSVEDEGIYTALTRLNLI